LEVIVALAVIAMEMGLMKIHRMKRKVMYVRESGVIE
jgi:hypothetical protein